MTTTVDTVRSKITAGSTAVRCLHRDKDANAPVSDRAMQQRQEIIIHYRCLTNVGPQHNVTSVSTTDITPVHSDIYTRLFTLYVIRHVAPATRRFCDQ